MKKVVFFGISIILLSVLLTYFIYMNNRVRYPQISDNARMINYNDNTNYNVGNRIDEGVEITYLWGHISNEVILAFDNYKPYKRLEMYESDGVFIVIYDEEKSGERKDRLFTVNDFPGFLPSSNGKNEYNVEIYLNGKRVKDVVISVAEE
ncbi:hypothetical protein I5677_08385 [Mobilitalea sibirica]|uniref:Uncharacterized protein n=1 Tax=Mobilitalea sibirica TaxID=1462919 RepID=A0A8J7H2S4_9FIRM|nr:hypothetical protein [Mobilitalea sibirica]MBH1940905.1 hypothetical protein [Mobilitalea sibirica]